jgi:hypothetical protein
MVRDGCGVSATATDSTNRVCRRVFAAEKRSGSSTRHGGVGRITIPMRRGVVWKHRFGRRRDRDGISTTTTTTTAQIIILVIIIRRVRFGRLEGVLIT